MWLSPLGGDGRSGQGVGALVGQDVPGGRPGMQRGPRRLLPDQVSYKLGALVTAFSLADSLPSGLVPHRATFDALVTARLFVRLATRHDGNSLSLGERRGPESGGDRDAETLF
jgi:hypothetical protein